MQKFNYHTHVYRCGHAVGTEEEMILAAIEAGFETIGISDHLPFKGWEDDYSRMPMVQMKDYLNTLKILKKKYKNQINVRIGFESEYFDDQVDWLKKVSKQVDYLVLGQHNYDFNSLDYFDDPYTSDEFIEKMADQICAGLNSGLFHYVCHPDYFLLKGCDLTESHKASLRRICECAKVNDAVIEINVKGTVYGKKMFDGVLSYHYPNTHLIKICSEVGCKVAFGYDAHSPEMLKCRDKETKLREMFKDYDLNYVDDLEM